METLRLLLTDPAFGSLATALLVATCVGALTLIGLRTLRARLELGRVAQVLTNIADPAQFAEALPDFEKFCLAFDATHPFWRRFLPSLVKPSSFAANPAVKATEALMPTFSGKAVLEATLGAVLIRGARFAMLFIVITAAALTHADLPTFAVVVFTGAGALAVHVLGLAAAALVLAKPSRLVADRLAPLVRAFPAAEQAALIHQEMQKLTVVSSTMEARLAAIEERVDRLKEPLPAPAVTAVVPARPSSLAVMNDYLERIAAAQRSLDLDIERTYASLDLGIGRPTRLASTKVVARRIGPTPAAKEQGSDAHLSELLAFLDLAEHHIETLADAGRELAEARQKHLEGGDAVGTAMIVSEIRSTLGRISGRGDRLEEGWRRYTDSFSSLDSGSRRQLTDAHAALASYRDAVSGRMREIEVATTQCLADLAKRP